ncbi:ABC transporter permease [Actinomadura litoris]|uniref:ABC transporter permease n=1 Tax=Actinomadura litoris TaxID=2678616 RepID=UPI001FA79C2A|nr:ABC transporter permease [Actinomadura litoris]
MTALDAPPPAAASPGTHPVRILIDGGVIARRQIEHLLRRPAGLVSELALPAIIVLLFGYVFGGAIEVPGGGDYREYLLPGVFAMQAVSGIGVTITTVAGDLARGVMDRFRAMPMARSAVPVGHTTASLCTGLVNFLGAALCALAVGWRAHRGVWLLLAAFGLLCLFRYATGWIGVAVGLSFKDEAGADHAVPLLFPISMIANTFVPTDGMPAWLRVIADWNPVSAVTAACRQLWGNPGMDRTHTALPLQHPVMATILWSVGIIAVCAPTAVWRFRTAGRH